MMRTKLTRRAKRQRLQRLSRQSYRTHQGVEPRFEPLEPRLMLTASGLTPDYPLITYNSTGTIVYDASAESFVLDATPLAFRETIASFPRTIVDGVALRDLDIQIRVDNAGNLLGGVAGDDLVITGSIDADGNIGNGYEYEGVLLTGEIKSFFSQDQAPGTTDFFDFIFTATGGALLTAGFYAGQDILVNTTSEQSNFAGSFAVDFNGEAKGVVGGTTPEQEPPVVQAKIDITPDATNQVGDPHTFTVTVMEDDGLAAAEGGDGLDGYTAAAGETVTVVLVDSNGAAVSGVSPLVGVTDASGQFQVTFTSLTGGLVTGSASANVMVGGEVVAVATDGTGDNSGAAEKTFVDAKITIGDDGTNVVGDPHTFTTVFWVDNGDGIDEDGEMGNYDRVLGADITVLLTDLGGASSVPVGPLAGQTNAAGEFAVTFSSATAGTTLGSATGSMIVGGVLLTRTTDGSETVTGSGTFNSDEANKTWVEPGIKLEKHTNGVDADDEADAPLIAPGDLVTWTYYVTNTGGVAYTQAEVEIVDDNGTPGDAGDDFSVSSGDIVLDASSDLGSDGILSAGETWVFTASAIAQDLPGGGVGTGVTETFYLDGSSGLDGADGNIRTFTSGSLSVNASAFSRTTGGAWAAGFLGSYSGGLGVTDTGEGSGGDGSHRVDNIDRVNYILFEFSENVIVDQAFLDSVVGDSDITVWVGTIPDAYNSHVTLNDAVLGGLTSEDNDTGSTTSRWANFNGAELVGNVLVIAASTSDTSPDDQFKIRKLKVETIVEEEHECYENRAVVTVPGATDDDLSHYCNPPEESPEPGLELEKLTNGVDADDPADAPIIAAGAAVTWTYLVTNTGNVNFTLADLTLVDDNGTPSDAADDFSIADGGITLVASSDAGSDGILSAGETWEFTASGIAEALGGSSGSGTSQTIYLDGSSSTDGSDGNVRTYSAGGVSVKASAFSRSTGGSWEQSYLGAYSGGLGVTDNSEGNGGDGMHRVDNVGKVNYVLFRFSETVIVDQAFLDSVVGDSDITVWVGNVANAYTSSFNLSDALLNGLTSEDNDTVSSSSRWADFNGAAIAGNVLVIAASTSDTSPDDRFKIRKLKFQTVDEQAGCYENKAVVTAGGVSADDLSHYCNPDEPAPTPKNMISGTVFKDKDCDGKLDYDEKGIQGVKVRLTGTTKTGQAVDVIAYTDALGKYKFSGLLDGTYKITEYQPDGYSDGKDTVGSHGGYLSNDMISYIKLANGANATGYNFAEVGMSSISGRVYVDADKDGKYDSGENGIQGVKIKLWGYTDSGKYVELYTYTDADGKYSFTNLKGGKYNLYEYQPSGYDDGSETAGSAGGSTYYNDYIKYICLDDCENATGYNFGEKVKQTSSWSWCWWW